MASAWQWDDLRFFLAVAREASLSGAARSLGVNHVRVGRRIAVLEKQLGAKLLHRTPDGLIPTAAGEAIQTRCETMQNTALEVERLVAGQDDRVAGAVRVTAPQGLARQLLVPMIAELRAIHPELQVNLVPGVRSLDLARGEADIALRMSFDRPTQGDLVCRKLGAIGSALYASRSYAERHMLPKRGEGLSGHELITFEGARWPKAMGPPLMGESLDGARVSLRSNDQFIRLDATIQGLGISEMPCFLGDETSELVRIWPKEPPHLRPVWLLTHRDLRRATRILVVSKAIVDGFGDHSSMLRQGGLPKSTL
ncbi:MAG: LysR family transcriptional regulator [Deltaproteobacteria bacterium]|nr:LysR family transcriptional regulator [Deltaproteobacteria bacterium]